MKIRTVPYLLLVGERIIFEIFKDGKYIATMGFAWEDDQLSEDEMATVVSTLACPAGSPPAER